jgi:subtilisin family serine protease
MKSIMFLSFFFLLLFRSMNSFAQDVSFYVKIEDQLLIPETIKTGKTQSLFIESRDSEFNSIVKKYKVSKFIQAFPTLPKTDWLSRVYYVKCDKRELGEELKNKFKERIPLVEYLCEPLLTYTPNDYGLELGQTNLDLIQAKNAWDICRDLPKIGIAITDTYFDLSHEDLNMTLIGGSNNPNTAAALHGTMVAGCIAAITNNNRGIASVGFNTNLFVSSNWASDNEVLRLAQAGYRVINCSWINSCQYSSVQDALYNTIRNTYNSVVVCGAGNAVAANHCGATINNVYPASYTSNISVTSVGHISTYGTQGSPSNNWKDVHEEIIGDSTTCHHHNAAVDICAPGYNVSTTDIMGSAGDNAGNYGSGWGTSFAAPQVSATLGLIFSINPCLSSNQGVAILLNNTDNSIYSIPENANYIGRLGTGRLNVYAAVTAAAETATRYLLNETLSGNQSIRSNYAIRAIGNVIIPPGANIQLITRKEVTINGSFEVAINSTFNIDVNVNNVISCN